MSRTPEQTPFEGMMHRYVDHQRALGRKFDTQAWVLGTVAKHLRRRGAEDLNAIHFEAWCHAGSAGRANVRRGAALIVHKFCRYRRRLDPTVFVPDASHFPRRVPYRAPVIFGPSEVSRMLRVAQSYPTPRHFPLYVPAVRIAVILLYTAGLRRGELARLALSDVDLKAGTLLIRESKFYKYAACRTIPASCCATANSKAGNKTDSA
jgi:integrase/recombinase XerD